jgi:hypothetical protein
MSLSDLFCRECKVGSCFYICFENKYKIYCPLPFIVVISMVRFSSTVLLFLFVFWSSVLFCLGHCYSLLLFLTSLILFDYFCNSILFHLLDFWVYLIILRNATRCSRAGM